jgi:alpha/beta superfamily hydrolase
MFLRRVSARGITDVRRRRKMAAKKRDLLGDFSLGAMIAENMKRNAETMEQVAAILNKPTIRYMTPEEEMRYLISTHDENNR